MANPPRQPTIPTEPAWVRLCRWLWKGLRWFWGAILLVVILNLFTSWLFAPLGTSFSRTPLGTLLGHPLPFFLGGVGLLGLTVGLWLINRLHPAPASQKTSPRLQAVLLTREDRRRLLVRLRSLYLDYMKQSLGMPRMELGLERTFEATAHPALSVSYRPYDIREAIAPNTPILDVYQEAGDGLLILGKPGAGKSTLLYDLAMALTERAERDATQLPPVLVSLASWAEKRLPLEQWLAEELQTKYQIQRTLATGWLLADQLLPLLDGLDEMVEEARSACIEAMNIYRQDHPLPLVVSSRSVEYLSQERKLHLQNAIEVQLLTPQQIDGYLKGEGKPLKAVRAALRRDAVLRDLVTTPLMLTVVMRAYRGKMVKDLPHLGTAEEQQRQVFEHYVTRMLEPTAKPTRKWFYPSDSTQKWLIWLAQQLQKRSLTEFYLERLQPSWLLPTVSTAQNTYPCLTTLVIMLLSAGLSFGLLFMPLIVSSGNPGWFVVGLFLFFCTAWGYFLGFLFGFGSPETLLRIRGFSRKRPTTEPTLNVRPAELLVWSWKGSWLEMLLLLVGVTLIAPVGFHMPYWLSNLMGLRAFPQPSLVTELLVGLFLGVALVACIILITGVSSTHLSKQQRNAPNQGIHKSGWNALRVGLIGMALFGLLAILGGVLVGLSTGISDAWEAGPAAGLVIGVFAGPFFVLYFGGAAYLQHYILRFLLWRAGSIPWHYVRFLDEAADRILLYRVGGGYHFIHPLFQEYFALLGTGTPANTQSESSPSP
jgi:NACHT domain